MKIDLNEEEQEFLLRICTRAQILAYKGITKHSRNMIESNHEKIRLIINKLSEKKR